MKVRPDLYGAHQSVELGREGKRRTTEPEFRQGSHGQELEYTH